MRATRPRLGASPTARSCRFSRTERLISLGFIFNYGGLHLSGNECHSISIIAIIRTEDPTGLTIHGFVAGEHKLRKELIAVRIIRLLAGVVATKTIFVIVVEPVALPVRAVFGESIGILLFILSEDNKLGSAPRLARLADISPKTGFFDKVSSAVEKIPGRLTRDLCVSLLHARTTHISFPHRSRAALSEQTASCCH